MQDRYFSDEELTAYLDGEVDFAPTQEIQAALATDPALQARLDALSFDTAALSEAFSGLSMNAQPVQMQQAPRGRKWVAMGSMIAATLLFGFGLGAWMSQPPKKGWVDYVAAYQALYGQQTLAHLNASAKTQQVELDRVLDLIGKTLDVTRIDVIPTAAYKRAQILQFKGKPLVQLSFLSDQGQPIALCIMRSTDDDTKSPITMVKEGLASAQWQDQGYGYFLIGGQSQTAIEKMAQAFVRAKI